MHDVEEMKIVLEALRKDLRRYHIMAKQNEKLRKTTLAEICAIRQMLQNIEGTS